MSDATGETDPEAEFSRLVLCRQDRMLRTIWRVARDAELAEEALHDALATLWRKLPVVARHPNPDAFVLRVCLDAACDRVRSRARRRRREVPLDAEEAARQSAKPSAPDAGVLGEVREAIARLGRRQRTAILLRAIHDAPYDAIARALGCSEATARVHVARAREKLRLRLSHLCGGRREGASR